MPLVINVKNKFLRNGAATYDIEVKIKNETTSISILKSHIFILERGERAEVSVCFSEPLPSRNKHFYISYKDTLSKVATFCSNGDKCCSDPDSEKCFQKYIDRNTKDPKFVLTITGVEDPVHSSIPDSHSTSSLGVTIMDPNILIGDDDQ